MVSSLQLHVRDLSENDLPAIDWSGGPLHPRYVGEALQRRAAAGDVDYLAVCGPNDQPIAIGGIDYAISECAGTLYQLSVVQSLQSRGIGSYLIEAAEQRIRARGRSVAELSVEEENIRARTLYERLGYVGFGTETDSWETETPSGGREIHRAQCIRMRKDLRPADR
jgi:ribosomal protein S18 acetylase RimI-like enzyme